MPDIDNTIATKVNPPPQFDALKTLGGLADLQRTQESTGLIKLQEEQHRRTLDVQDRLARGDIAGAMALDAAAAKMFIDTKRQQETLEALDKNASSAARGNLAAQNNLARYPAAAGEVAGLRTKNAEGDLAANKVAAAAAAGYLKNQTEEGWQTGVNQLGASGAISPLRQHQLLQTPIAQREGMARSLISSGQSASEAEQLDPQPIAERQAATERAKIAGPLGISPPPAIRPGSTPGLQSDATPPAPMSQPGDLARLGNKVAVGNAMTADTAKAAQAYMFDRQGQVEGSQQALKAIEEIDEHLKNTNTGPGAATLNDISSGFSKVGIDINKILPGGLQTDPKEASIVMKNMEQLQAAWAKGQFPNRITDSDMMIATRANPNFWLRNDANKILLGNLKEVMRIRLEEARFMRSESARLQRTGDLPTWEVIDRWHNYLAKLPGVSDEMKRSFMSFEELDKNKLSSGQPDDSGPAGAVSTAMGPNGRSWAVPYPGGGFHWVDKNGRPIK